MSAPDPPDPPDPLVAVLGEIHDVLREIRDAMPKPVKISASAMPSPIPSYRSPTNAHAERSNG